MFCSNCGNTIADGAKFCPNCGGKIEYGVVPASLDNDNTEKKFEKENKSTFDKKDFLRNFNFEGRRDRKTYLIYFGVEVFLFALFSIFPLLWIFPLWIDITNDIKRLHDTGLSGFYYIGFGIGYIVLGLIFPLLGVIFALGVVGFLFFKEGMPYENKYGAVQ